jgi:vacuolar protein 8
VRPQILKKFGVLCLHADADIRRFSVLALANLCLNVESHHGLEVEDLVSVLYNVIINDDFAKCHDKNDDKTFHKFVESKSFACLAISALCRNSSIVRRMTEVGIISALLKLLQLDAVEMKFHVAFVLNKLSMFRATHQELCRKQVASFLTNPNQESNGYALTYLIAALRRLCGDNIIRVELISLDVVNFMEKVCDLQNIERCREIASGICHLALWDEARVHIMQSDMFGHILSLAQSSDVETSRFALGALANIAYDNRFHDVFAEKAGVVHTLVTLTKHPTLAVVRESSRALSNVFSSILAQTTFFRDGETDSLVNISKLEDYECAYNAAVAFRKLSANSLAHEYFLSCDWLSAVFDLSRREERNIQLQIAAALRDFSSNQDFKVAFAEMGGIHTAIELSSHPDIDLKAIAFGIIRHLSIPMQLKRKLVDCGIVSIMADCATLADNEDLLYQCASSIANMAEHAHNKVALVNMGVLRCLVALCKHDSFQVVKRETARAFSLLSCAPENNVGVFDEKVLPHVIALLSCHEEETCRDSAATINNVATSPEIKKMIGDLGGIPHLVLLLASPHESCQINASRALSRLTTVNENKVSVFCSGGLKPLIQQCTSSNLEVSLTSIMVLCNLSTCSGYQIKFVEENGLPTVNQLLTSAFPLISKYATMILCNLTSHQLLQDHVSRQISLMHLVDLMNDINLECRAFATMTLCNLASKVNHGSAILDAGGLRPLLTMVNSKDGTNLQRGALLTLYNLSACETSHPLFVENNVTPSIVTIINGSPDLLCRRFALMILANVACNDKTRAAAVKGGGLQAAVLSLKDDDLSSRRFASIILANMSNDGVVRSQIVVHGGLQPLVTLCLADDVETQYCAFVCLSNLAANESNHSPLMKQGAFKAFVNASSLYIKRGGSPCSTFGITNLTSNGEILSEVGRDGGIMPLIYLVKSDNLHYQCLALSSLRRLAFIRENRDIMVANGIVETLTDACNTAEPVIQREVASCFCNLSLSSNHRLGIARLAMSEISYLTKSDDLDIVRLSLGALGNLAEDIETHAFMNNAPILDAIVACLEREGIDVRREAGRGRTHDFPLGARTRSLAEWL